MHITLHFALKAKIQLFSSKILFNIVSSLALKCVCITITCIVNESKVGLGERKN